MTPDERLIEAAQKGNISDLIDLLPRANARCDESSPLRGAAMYGHATCVELLLPHSDVGARKCSALRMAFLYNHSACVKVLVEPSVPFICQSEDESFRFSEMIRSATAANSPALLDIVPLVGGLPCIEQTHILHMAVRHERMEFIDQLLNVCDLDSVTVAVQAGTVADPGLFYLTERKSQLQRELLLTHIDTDVKTQIARKM